MNTIELKHLFIVRKGYFNQEYKSLRLQDCEITIDNLLPNNRYQLSICTPYNDKLDGQKHHFGCGAGEVKKCWHFDSEERVYDFLIRSHML